MEGSKSILSPTSFLMCDENFLGGSGFEAEEIFEDECGDDVDEYIQILLDKEIANGGPQMQEFLHSSGIQGARSEGIHYILRKSENLRFGFQTSYASVTYLDRFLSERSVDVEKSWVIRLLAMACLSLAAKMEEIWVPALSEFCMEDFNFESNVIQKMELIVLSALRWKMGVHTPFNFIKFFAKSLCDISLPQKEFSRIVDVVINAMKYTSIMCNRSSVIAAAATLAVLDQELTKDALQLKIDGLASPQCFDTESIFSCYNLFKEKEVERLNISKSTPVSSHLQLQPNGSSSVASSKRKRLVFDPTDELGDVDGKKPKP